MNHERFTIIYFIIALNLVNVIFILLSHYNETEIGLNIAQNMQLNMFHCYLKLFELVNKLCRLFEKSFKYSKLDDSYIKNILLNLFHIKVYLQVTIKPKNFKLISNVGISITTNLYNLKEYLHQITLF